MCTAKGNKMLAVPPFLSARYLTKFSIFISNILNAYKQTWTRLLQCKPATITTTIARPTAMDTVGSFRLLHNSEEEKKTPDAPSDKRYIDFGVWTLRAKWNDTRSLALCWAVLAINKSAWADTRAEQQQWRKKHRRENTTKLPGRKSKTVISCRKCNSADKIEHNANWKWEKLLTHTRWQFPCLFYYSVSNSISINPKWKWNLIESLRRVLQMQQLMAHSAPAIWSKSPWNHKNGIYNWIKLGERH